MPKLPIIHSAGTFDGESHFPSMTRSPERVVHQYELELYYEDGGISILNGQEYPIRRGMLLITRPGDIRRSTMPFQNYFIRLNDVDEELAALLDGVAGVIMVENSEPFETAFRSISGWFLSDDAYTRTAAAAQVYLLVRMAHQHGLSQKHDEPSEGDVVTLAQQYIEQHYQEELSVEDIARACHVSASYLHRLFVGHLKLTPHNALMRRRIIAAKALLINEPYSIADVAWRCGFQSASYFSDCFRKWVGMSPHKFRQETGYQL